MSADVKTLLLTDLAVGESGTIRDVAGSRLQRMKLLDVGLTPQTRVTVTKRAPMGNPLEISLRSYILTLRKEEAALISLVNDCPPSEQTNERGMDERKTNGHGTNESGADESWPNALGADESRAEAPIPAWKKRGVPA